MGGYKMIEYIKQLQMQIDEIKIKIFYLSKGDIRWYAKSIDFDNIKQCNCKKEAEKEFDINDYYCDNKKCVNPFGKYCSIECKWLKLKNTSNFWNTVEQGIKNKKLDEARKILGHVKVYEEAIEEIIKQKDDEIIKLKTENMNISSEVAKYKDEIENLEERIRDMEDSK
jgi:hypothetical protein